MSTDLKEVVKEKYGQAALRVHSGGSSCCGASTALDELLRSHHDQPLRRGASEPDPRGCAEGLAGVRQSDGLGAAPSRRNGARPGVRRWH